SAWIRKMEGRPEGHTEWHRHMEGFTDGLIYGLTEEFAGERLIESPLLLLT
ncbi:13784_t:CDS:1, partial [Gigaspora rosea]